MCVELAARAGRLHALLQSRRAAHACAGALPRVARANGFVLAPDPTAADVAECERARVALAAELLWGRTGACASGATEPRSARARERGVLARRAEPSARRRSSPAPFGSSASSPATHRGTSYGTEGLEALPEDSPLASSSVGRPRRGAGAHAMRRWSRARAPRRGLAETFHRDWGQLLSTCMHREDAYGQLQPRRIATIG
jgi:hypothetical protein